MRVKATQRTAPNPWVVSYLLASVLLSTGRSYLFDAFYDLINFLSRIGWEKAKATIDGIITYRGD